MRVYSKNVILAIVVLICLSACGCSNYFTAQDEGYDAGVVLTPEELESIYESVSASITEKYPTETDEDGEPVVFWLKGGSVWHVSASCASIKKAAPEDVFSGSVSDAVKAEKERACAICSQANATE